MHYAAHAGHAAVVELLVSQRAKVSAADKQGTQPIQIAAQQGHNAVVELLASQQGTKRRVAKTPKRHGKQKGPNVNKEL